MKTLIFLSVALLSSSLAFAQDGPSNSTLYPSYKAELNYSCEFEGEKYEGTVTLPADQVSGTGRLHLKNKNTVSLHLVRDRSINHIRFEIYVNKFKTSDPNEGVQPQDVTRGFLTENKKQVSYGLSQPIKYGALKLKSSPLVCQIDAELF